jgi:hypothetical protein
MTIHKRSYAGCGRPALSDLRATGRSEAVVTAAVRVLKLTVADALSAYALTGSALATLLALATPHLEVVVGCFFHGRG